MQIGVETTRAVENKRIFVIDDDEIIRAALQFMLHDENETHELGSLAEAYAKGTGWRPDLLLLGLGIVETDGPAVMREIKARFPAARILIVAADAGLPPVQACLAAGAHGVITTPLTIAGVRLQADRQLGRRQAALVPLLTLS